MPFCPNPECPHVRKHGRAAAFVDGVAICTDCGSQLTEEEMFLEKEKKSGLSDLQKRIFYTLGMLAIFRMLAHIPAPGIYGEALDRFLADRGGAFLWADIFGFQRMTVFALGLMPYITASVAVEIIALFIRPFKSWRKSGYHGRVKLRQTALVLTLVLATAQGYGIAHGLAGMGDGRFVYDSGMGYRLFLVLTLATGTFILIGIAGQITRKGIGHGISIIILASSAAGVLSGLSKLINMNDRHILHESPFEYVFLAAIISALLIAIIVIMERTSKRIGVKYEDGMSSSLSLKLTTAGIVPAEWAGFLIFMPTTIMGFINVGPLQEFARFLSPGTSTYSIIYALVIFFLYILFTSSFYRPKDMLSLLQHKGATLAVPIGKDPESYMDHILEIMAFVGAAYLCLLFFIPEILIRLGFPIFLGGMGLITTVAIVLDVLEEFRIRRNTNGMTKVMEFHEAYEAGLFKGILEQRGIPCILRGYYHRSLLYFFGPYIEISVLVPSDKCAEASELFERYIA